MNLGELFSRGCEYNNGIASLVVAMSNPLVVIPEAVEAVKELFRRSMEEHTQVIMERLDQVEDQLSATANQHPEESTSTQGMSGIPRTGGQGSSCSLGRAPLGLAEQEAITPGGGGGASCKTRSELFKSRARHTGLWSKQE